LGRVLAIPDLARAVVAAEPRLGQTRLVAVDGPAGSGKTTLAGRLAAELVALLGPPVPVVHLDDLYEGWEQPLEALAGRLEEQLLAPIRGGRAGRYRRYDWPTRQFAEWHDVPATATLVLEGVGAAPAAFDTDLTLLVWVEAPEAVRLRRGLERDGERLREEWLRWQVRELEHALAERTRDRADLVVDGDLRPGLDRSRDVVVLRSGRLASQPSPPR
jgi:uridine kinase